MTILRNVSFKSPSFNTTTPRDYFINECCFGDDVARWFLQELRARGIHTGPEPDQEDFGWYITFRIDETDYDLIIAYRPGPDDQSGDWIGVIERKASFLATLFGARRRNIVPAAPQLIHDILSKSPQITDIRWYKDEDLNRETNGQNEPS